MNTNEADVPKLVVGAAVEALVDDVAVDTLIVDGAAVDALLDEDAAVDAPL